MGHAARTMTPADATISTSGLGILTYEPCRAARPRRALHAALRGAFGWQRRDAVGDDGVGGARTAADRAGDRARVRRRGVAGRVDPRDGRATVDVDHDRVGLIKDAAELTREAVWLAAAGADEERVAKLGRAGCELDPL